MSVWRASSLATCPSVTLRDWCVFEAHGTANDEKPTVHLVGYNIEESEGRVSSDVISFDIATHRGTTKSGRIYELRGPPGLEGDGAYTWERWKTINRVIKVVDVAARFFASPGTHSRPSNRRIE